MNLVYLRLLRESVGLLKNMVSHRSVTTLTNISITSIHEAFEKTCERAELRGIRVTGSELIGLVPKNALLDAGKHFLKKQNRSLGIHEEEIMKIAVKSLGLDELAPFQCTRTSDRIRFRG